MATLLMHLYVGWELQKTHPAITDRPQFYLGCIAPDAVNLEGFAPKEKRWGAHLRSGDLPTWYRQIGDFYRREHGRVEENLLLGYCIHNLTDVAWDECFHDRVWREMERLALPPMMDMGPGWDDCFRFDFEELHRPWWQEEVAPALAKATPARINGLSAELLDAYRADTLNHYPGTIPKGNPILVEEVLVSQLTQVVTQRMETHLGL